MTHPATAEGIYQGMRSGIIAAEVLKDTLAGSISDEKAGGHIRRALPAHIWFIVFVGKTVASCGHVFDAGSASSPSASDR